MTLKKDCRISFANTVIELARKDDCIVVVCNDSVSSSNMKQFEALFPSRIFNVGIAEQNMIGVSAGLANSGLIPVVCAASCFLCARAYEQIKVDIGYSNSNVKLFAVSPGFAYGALGATHHSPEDITLINSIPNISIAVPSDSAETEAATKEAIISTGPTFVRVLRTPVPSLAQKMKHFTFGKSNLYSSGSDVLFITNGAMIHNVIEASVLLENKGISCGIINASSISPFDKGIILREAKKYRFIVTVEEASIYGGLGSKVARLVSRYIPATLLQLGVDDFAPTGNTEQIFSHFGLDKQGIFIQTMQLINEFRSAHSLSNLMSLPE